MKYLATTTAALMAAALLWAGAAAAAEFGTADEAHAMLDRAVAEMKRDKDAAIAKFNKGEAGFRDRDLYVFCATPDGNTVAHPTNVGTNLKQLKDKRGKAFGAEMFKVAREGKVKKVTYMWPKPGSDKPVEKVTYVTRVAGDVCGVGYYK
jgi:signal transduction histidine kinase